MYQHRSPARSQGSPLEDVVLLRWPERDAERPILERERRPRLLLVDPAAEPPETWTALEDWIRRPADPDDLYARITTLRTRVRPPASIEFDDDSIVRRGRSWVALPRSEMAVLRPLAEHLGQVVQRSDLVRAAAQVSEQGDAYTSPMLDATMARLRARLPSLGVRLRSIRGAGYLLELTEEEAK